MVCGMARCIQKSRLQGIDYKSLQECLQSVYKKDIREKGGKKFESGYDTNIY